MNKKQYLTVADIASRSYKRAGLPKEWTTHLGDPEMGQTIIIWGQSASGKSYYAMKLAKTLTPEDIILVNLSGRGDKDIDFVAENYGI